MTSRLLKIKKYLASKMSESAAGRSVIISAAGATGDKMLQAINSCFTKHSGASTAQTLRVHIFKLASKCMVLYQNDVFTVDYFQDAREPTLTLLNSLIETLETIPRDRNAASLASQVNNVHDLLLPLLKPHMKQANWSRWTALCQYFSQPEFLERFLRDETLEAERMQLLSLLKQSVRPYDMEIAAILAFRRAQLMSKRKRLAALLENPQLDEFLKDENSVRIIQSWLADVGGEESMLPLVHLVRAVRDFKQIVNKSLLEGRAAGIWRRFFDSETQCGSSLPAEVVRALKNEMDSGNYQKRMFDDAEAAAMAGETHMSPFCLVFTNSRRLGGGEAIVSDCAVLA